MSLSPRTSLLVAGALLLGSSLAHALPVTFKWPANTKGAYKVHGVAEQPLAETKTLEIPERQSIRVTGQGFDFGFMVDHGEVTFPKPLLKDKMGVRFDRKTNTFSFVTTNVTLDIKDCDVPVDWQGIPLPQPDDKSPANGRRQYTVIFGHHQLKYPGTTVPFFVDERGTVTLGRTIAGLSAQGSTLSIQGLPLTITAKDPNWQIARVGQPSTAVSGTVRLLPSDTGYTFQSGGSPRASIPFFLGVSGSLAAQKDGPYQEFISLADKTGVDIASVAIPDGEALYHSRIALEKSEKENYEQTLAGSATAAWKMDFPLRDLMQFYNFEEQQISYPIKLPPDIDPAKLKLLAFADSTVRSIPFQISESKNADGSGGSIIFFRADLPRGGSRLYRLVAGFDAKGVQGAEVQSPRLEKTGDPHEALLQNGLIRVRVPAGAQTFAGGKPLAQVPAPIISITRKETSAVTGSFSAPDALVVESIETRVVESSPLFLIYEISYALQGGKKYSVRLELRANEAEVAIAESFTGFQPEDSAFLRLDYTRGLNPDHRLVASNGGYDFYSGDYSKGVGADAKLNYVLTLYAPNSIGIARATAFYNDKGEDALLLAVNRPREWVTSKRAVWGSNNLPENLTFYARGTSKYMTARLAGSKRFWVLGLIPRDQAVLTVQEGLDAPAAGPEVRLFNRLTDWSLNTYKDRLADWQEKLDAAAFDAKDFNAGGGFSPVSCDDFVKEFFKDKTFFRWVRNASWDFSSENSPVSFRDMTELFGKYAVSRASWTPEQREQVRQALLFIADSSENDANLPHHSMLAGHPNFVMDVKTTLPLAAATFPTNPRAKIWKDSFMGYYNEWLDTYSRKDVPELHTTGGRWTENLACYVGQCFVGLLDSQKSLVAYDGTSLAKNPQLLSVIRWMRDSFMSPHDGVRLIPPQGAHSRAFEPDQKFRNSLFQFCAAIAPDAPQLAQEMKWIETNGKEGTKPDVKSSLFTDYGPVMHYDFGGPHESYAHMQLLYGSGYRWANAGIVYYGAKNKVWSYNNEDTNGDDFNWNAVTAFTVDGKGLARRPVDQLLFDFDFAQFYRQPGEVADAYKARAIMMVRDDYLVISDEVTSADTAGKFTWASVFDLPQIYQLKPAATPVDSEAHDKLPRHKEGPPDRVGHIRSYSGKGDFLTIVAPAALKAEATPFGARVNGDYVFASQAPLDIKQGPVLFVGNYGYARPNQLALFQGTAIGLDGFILRREGGDFGVSASAEKNRVTGRIAGSSGGKISITLPAGAQPGSASVKIDGQSVPHTTENGALVFPVEIAQKDGLKTYEITW